MNSKIKVLVMDAQMRNSLAIIRSLGKKGFDITGAEDTFLASGFFSRFCKTRIVYPNPSFETNSFKLFMLNLVKNKHFDCIFPVTDATVIPISQLKNEISKYTIVPLPDYEILSKAMDKAETIKIASENGIDCPETFVINNDEDLDKVKNSSKFPVIIKPRRSSGSRGLTFCHDKEELYTKYRRTEKAYGPCIIQEYIPAGGEELGVYLLLNFKSEVRAVTVQKRLRSYPVTGGPSTLRETVYKPELEKIAVHLLKVLNWSGIAMVEFKKDPRDNKFKLMEINPRWWGSLQLSILSGVDFPYLLYKLYSEGDIEPVTNSQIGTRCRWLLPGDFLWFLNVDNKFSHLWEFLKFERNDDIISWKDPGPTLGIFLASSLLLFNKNMRRIVFRKSLDKT